MAEAALIGASTKVALFCGKWIVEESSRLRSLSQEIQGLEDQLKHMRAYAKVTDARQVNHPQVIILVNQIRDLALDVEYVLDDYVPKIEQYKSRGFFSRIAKKVPYVLTCSNFLTEIQKIKKRIEAIDEHRRTYGIPGIDARFDRVAVGSRTVAHHVDDKIVVGLDKDVHILKTKLLSEDKKLLFVSVVGMPGVGKTTLAEKVFESVKGRFDCSASVSVSQQPNLKDVFENIAKQVGVPDENRKKNLEANLCTFLQRKRYILLVDDLWCVQTWNKLAVGFPLSDCVNGSRIIITSRDTGVGRYIAHERSLHHLKPFDFPTSWSLFLKLMVPSLLGSNQGLRDSRLLNIGREIVKRCGNIPLAIVVAVDMLRELEMSAAAWNEMLGSIWKDQKDKCSRILALSYKDLPATLKLCFLYLGLFPKGHEIQVSELARLWMAEKFIKDEEAGEIYINKLVSRNLVQVASWKHDGRVKCIRIHDLLHSMCMNLAKEINFSDTLHNQNPNFGTKALRLSINQRIDEAFTTRELRALLFFKGGMEISRKNLKAFLQRSPRLQVLRKSCFADRPIHIKKMDHLNFLKSSGGVRLSKVNLKYLQSLDLRCWSGRTQITIDFIWKMKQLRHVFLCGDQTPIGRPSSNDISLPNLRTLSGVISIDIDFMGPSTFPNLRKFGLIGTLRQQLCGRSSTPISSELTSLCLAQIKYELRFAKKMRTQSPAVLAEDIKHLNLSGYSNLTKLEIVGIKFRELPLVYQFPPNLLKLKLVKNYSDVDPMPVLRKLLKLKILVLGLLSYDGRKLDCSGEDAFPQLEVLHIRGLQNLEMLSVGRARGMHRLREFVTDYCPRFQTYPEWLQRLWTKGEMSEAEREEYTNAIRC